MSPRILIVDDHAGFRRSARALLEAEGFDVVGEAADGTSALADVERLQPAVVLLDIQLEGIDGFAIAGDLSRRPDPPSVILISSREASEYGPLIAQAPVHGFLPKRRLSGEAIRSILAR